MAAFARTSAAADLLQLQVRAGHDHDCKNYEDYKIECRLKTGEAEQLLAAYTDSGKEWLDDENAFARLCGLRLVIIALLTYLDNRKNKRKK